MNISTIATELIFSTVRIVASKGRELPAVGTGFVFETLVDGKATHYCVTNKHVLEGCSLAEFHFVAKSNENVPDLGRASIFKLRDIEHAVIGHPGSNVDICVIPMNRIIGSTNLVTHGRYPYFKAFAAHQVPKQSEKEKIDAIEDVLFIGYPENLYDSSNLTPIVRRGVTATPYELDYKNQPTFLIDANVFPGSSGSPVILYSNQPYVQGGTVHVADPRLFLLGVVSARIEVPEEGEVEFTVEPAKIGAVWKSKYSVNLGVVFKSHTILDCIQPTSN